MMSPVATHQNTKTRATPRTTIVRISRAPR
jgi:hypothetical protein